MIWVLFERIAKLGILAVWFIVKFMPAVTGITWLLEGSVKATSMGKAGVKLEGKTSGMT